MNIAKGSLARELPGKLDGAFDVDPSAATNSDKEVIDINAIVEESRLAFEEERQALIDARAESARQNEERISVSGSFARPYPNSYYL